MLRNGNCIPEFFIHRDKGISIEKSLFFARKHGNSMTGQLELDPKNTIKY
jgi:hypothetical protein